jgi:predicted NAD/FAD-dependent oxidoreductase
VVELRPSETAEPEVRFETGPGIQTQGDWTDCGFNEGCVEAAVMSGRLAAHAIAETPALEDIIGYDHP